MPETQFLFQNLLAIPEQIISTYILSKCMFKFLLKINISHLIHFSSGHQQMFFHWNCPYESSVIILMHHFNGLLMQFYSCYIRTPAMVMCHLVEVCHCQVHH